MFNAGFKAAVGPHEMFWLAKSDPWVLSKT